MLVKFQLPQKGKNMKKCCYKFFRNGTGPLYPGLCRVVCNGGVQPGLAHGGIDGCECSTDRAIHCRVRGAYHNVQCLLREITHGEIVQVFQKYVFKSVKSSS